MNRDAVSQPAPQAGATRAMASALQNPARVADSALTPSRIDARPSVADDLGKINEIDGLRRYIRELRQENAEKRRRNAVLEQDNARLRTELERVLTKAAAG